MNAQLNEKVFYFALIFGCLIAFPLSTPYVDLMLICVYLIFLVSKVSGYEYFSTYSKSLNLLSVALFSYLIIRDIISIISFFDIKTIRVLLVHLVLLILITLKINLLNDKFDYRFVLKISVFYFALYDIFYVFTRLTEQDWAKLQTVYLTGSVYAAIPFLYISYVILENSTNASLKSEYYVTFLALISAVLYSSRTLLLFILVFLIIYCFKSKVELIDRLKFVFGLLLLAFSLSFFFGIFVSHSREPDIIKSSDAAIVSEYKHVGSNNSIIRFINDISSSALFLVNNRKPDDDRKAHIMCAFESLENRTLINNLFGSGTNTYRYTLATCSQFGGQGYSDTKIERNNRGSQSISFTIIMLDYGLLVFILLFLIFIKRLHEFYQGQITATYILYFLLNSYLFFIINLGFALIIWLFLTSRKLYQPYN